MASFRKRGKLWTAYCYATDPATGERRQRSKGASRAALSPARHSMPSMT